MMTQTSPLELKFETREGCTAPTKAYVGDAGWDLYVAPPPDEPEKMCYQLQEGSILRIWTGVKVTFPFGYHGEIRPRSSSPKHGFFIANAPGTIDPSYTGEIIILLRRFKLEGTPSTVYVNVGEKIAQLVITPHYTGGALGGTILHEGVERGEKGFGSSGQ